MNNGSPAVETTSAYIPMDRRLSLAHGETLSSQVEGAALFADISGFTPLTEALVRELGPQRGAEELTHHLNRVYDALINDLHTYGGSVISFSGDAITCWFGNDSGIIATRCALVMQQTMQQFSQVSIPSGKMVSLAMKAAVAAGTARRFVVGDPNIQRMDVLAGSTLVRLTAAEHQAEKGEVILDAVTVAAVEEQVQLAAWRVDEETGERFGLITALTVDKAPKSLSSDQLLTLSEAEIRPWLLPPVYERLQAKQGEFLAELRPAVALFLRFGGIDYDADEAAGEKLDAFICWVQQVLARYDVYPLQLTVGDKGSYLYAAFGAPVAHEDDTIRAVSAALELRSPPSKLDFIGAVQIGISQGSMRTGAYGGQRRRTYGALGDDVNLAARLMQAAQPGQVLVSSRVRFTTDDLFDWESLPPLTVKGKAEQITVYSVIGRTTRQTRHLQSKDYALPMVGRKRELGLIKAQLQKVLQGRGQVLGITGPAGSGKTRLVAEAIDMAVKQNLVGYGGECQSYGTKISYLVWQSIWRGIFDVGASDPLESQIEALTDQLERIDPALVQRLPLLGALLNITIPDNDLTSTFDAQLRKTSLESLLVSCLQAKVQRSPLLLVLEDTHWLDPLSLDLLDVIGHSIVDLPVLIVVAYRMPELQNLRPPWAMMLPNFSEVSLSDFSQAEAEQLIQLKLRQFMGDEAEIPETLIERIMVRAEGNPFYIDEFLNYLRDRKIDPRDSSAVDRLDLPDSLHSLILSRIDQLTESQKTTLKVASVIGRLFKEGYLRAAYPQLGEPQPVRADLETLTQLNLTAPDTSETELTYFFKHIITQEVAYGSLPFATRALLHERLARFLEDTHSEALSQYVPLLAFHFGHSQNDAKKRVYFLKAGEAAQADYANEAAIDYYQRVLPLLPADEKVAVMLKLGEVLQLVGKWPEADRLYQQAQALAEALGDQPALARIQTAIAELLGKQGLFDESSTHFELARTSFMALDDRAGLAQVLRFGGTLAAQQGDLDKAMARYEEGLLLYRALEDKWGVAASLTNLGIVARRRSDYEQARVLLEEALDVWYELLDRRAIAITLNNLGNVALDQGDYEGARAQLEVAVDLQREIGDRQMTAIALHSLGGVTRAQNDFETTRRLYEESLMITWELGDRGFLAYLLEDIGGLAALQGQPKRALRLYGAAIALRENIGSPLSAAYQEKLDTMLEPARRSLDEEAAAEAEAAGRALSLEHVIEEALQKS